MGADSIIEATIVTLDGRVLKANACQNQDLFWAIRGGGGGTFGIITSLTVKAHEMPSVTVSSVEVAARNSTPAKTWYRLVAQMHTHFPKLQDAGMHGYYTMSGSDRTMILALLQYNVPNATSSKKLLEPLQELLNAANSSVTHTVTTLWVPEWYMLNQLLPTSGNVGSTRGTRASRLIPRRALVNVDLLAQVLETAASPNNVTVRNPHSRCHVLLLRFCVLT